MYQVAMGFNFFIPEVMDRVKLQDSMPQNGLKIIHNDHTYITEDYTSLCLNIICNRKNPWLIYFNILTGPYPVVHRNESVLKNI
jgi:hypothetical protein